ncbi:phenylacetate--CoA ligase family protein [Accumulibacter sp.]|uniref:phenylacetate--CoA ligase family protein n=1 Tax=Accumulibacter sp. TaxID=2053492 RepID=UPI002628C66B|nr:phenylacetate--CoA ligase family protein [Accumulibacter sp.]
MKTKEIVLSYAPVCIQNLAITLYNMWLHKRRRGGAYRGYLKYFSDFRDADFFTIDREQQRRLREFLEHAVRRSVWYRDYSPSDLMSFPVLEKEQLLNNLDLIKTVAEKEGDVSLTGGTTGASMKVVYTLEDIQERHAILDLFRSAYGYAQGKRTAWFSGKAVARRGDLARGICYRDDHLRNIRYFSTFHISSDNFDAYWRSFTSFAPEFIVGFPSSVYDMCVMARERGLEFKGSVRAFFPTAETVLPTYREVIGSVLGCRLYDQYASSEGAPFILECENGGLHIHPLTGVFEVVDDDLEPTIEGQLLVTSFSTRGTPLIRYRIGDRVKLAPSDYRCSCGSAFPVVEFIDGRTSDFLWSPQNGRVNLGNISNCTKDVKGIVCFQIVQESVDSVTVFVVSGTGYDQEQEDRFRRALLLRLGDRVTITIQTVEKIARETSGKFRLVKNFLTTKELPD